MQTLTYHHDRVATDAIIEADNHDTRLRANDITYTLSNRARSQLPHVLGMKKSRIHQLASNGGITVAEQIRGSEYSDLTMTTTPSNVIIAFANQEPKPTDEAGMLTRMEAAGFLREDIDIIDGRLTGYLRTSLALLVGTTSYAHGISLNLDLAGYEAPEVATFLERLICSNGASIDVFAESRAIPMYSADVGINADNIDTHVRAWKELDVPDGVIDRLRQAEEVPASLAEVRGLRSALASAATSSSLGFGGDSPFIGRSIADGAIDTMMGDFRAKHGVASLREIPAAQQHYLPSQTSVLGLFNLGTEFATHHLRHHTGGAILKDWWNRLLSRNFDLEGIMTEPTELPEFWLETSRARRASRN